MADDFELLEAWARGDRDAGRALTQRHFAGLRRFFLNKVDEGVEDLIQETLLSCMEAADRIREASSFRAYLYAVARNGLYAWLRKRRRQGDFDGTMTSIAELAPSPSSVLARRDDERALLHALRGVPLDHQIVLELYYWEQLSTAELGEALGVPKSTVTTRLQRAREQLRKRLEGSAVPEHGTDDDLEAWARRVRDEIDR